jgi:hypothetical protein
VNDERLKSRVEGRKAAKAVLHLASEEAMRIANGGADVEAWKAFWEEIRTDAVEHCPLPPVEHKVLLARPLTDEQAREFEKQEVPFGQHARQRVADVPLGYLRWLADQIFIDQLRAYLANETIEKQSA